MSARLLLTKILKPRSVPFLTRTNLTRLCISILGPGSLCHVSLQDHEHSEWLLPVTQYPACTQLIPGNWPLWQRFWAEDNAVHCPSNLWSLLRIEDIQNHRKCRWSFRDPPSDMGYTASCRPVNAEDLKHEDSTSNDILPSRASHPWCGADMGLHLAISKSLQTKEFQLQQHQSKS